MPKRLTDAQISKLSRLSSVFLFLDYDGTLTPLVRNPEKALLASSTRRLFYRLSKLRGTRIALISGRELSTLRRLSGIRGNFTLIGNHGLAIHQGRRIWYYPGVKRIRALISGAAAALAQCPVRFPGARVENKKLGLSFHYRAVEPGRRKALSARFRDCVGPWLAGGKLKLCPAKKVWELRPDVNWNKGTAARWLLESHRDDGNGRCIPIFIGDDKTDEDGFRMLRKYGVTIRVGKGRSTSAEYFVSTQAEAIRFLRLFLRLREDRS